MRRNAFTLIELLIVLAILGILVASVSLSLADIPEMAQQRAMAMEKDQVQKAIDIYNSQEVTVGTEAPISALPGTLAVRVGPESQPDFGRYVRRQTKYFYAWTDEGADLTAFKYADKAGPSE